MFGEAAPWCNPKGKAARPIKMRRRKAREGGWCEKFGNGLAQIATQFCGRVVKFLPMQPVMCLCNRPWNVLFLSHVFLAFNDAL